MGFRRVKYINFRNIEPQEVQLSGGLNLLTGLNSSGKTNFLEGISLLSGWGPFEGGTKTKDLAARESREKNTVDYYWVLKVILFLCKIKREKSFLLNILQLQKQISLEK